MTATPPGESIARRVLAYSGLLIGIGAFGIAIWIVLPAPTMFFLTFGVGGPEVSHVLIVAGLIGIACTLPTIRRSRVGVAGCAVSGAAVALALTVWLRVPSTIARFDRAMAGLSSPPTRAQRASPIVALDLFRRIPRGTARVTRNRAFTGGPGAPLVVDIYQPPEAGLYPIVVQIYGGAWQRGVPGDNSGFATWLAAAGYVVVAIDYRHAPAFRWPTQIQDVDAALRWIAEHGREFDGDVSRTVLLGRSAGAHLATYAAWFTSPFPVRGVVSFYGPADLAASYRQPPRPDPIHSRDVERALLGGPLDSMPDRYADASTITHLPALHGPPPPSLLIYGARDHIVEAKYGEAVSAALRAAGGQVAYLEIPWAEHGFDNVFNGPSSQLSLFYIERFLAHVTTAAR